MAAASLFILFFFHVLMISVSVVSQREVEFVYNGFHGGDLDLDGIATLLPSGLLQMTNTSTHKMSHAFHKNPIEFDPSHLLSFSTNMVFAMVPPSGKQGGHGMAFVVSGSMDFSHAEPAQFLGIFNNTNNGSPSSPVLAVEFDTVLSIEFKDKDLNHVGIDVNSLESVESASASYFNSPEGSYKSLDLSGGDPIQAWIDYDGREMTLNVTIAPIKSQRPDRPLLSRKLNLSTIFSGNIYVGFSASTGSFVSDQYLLGWSFSKGGQAQSLKYSKLPRLPPRRNQTQKPSPLLIILFVLLAIIGLAIIGGVCVYRRTKYAEVREEWEKEYGPHRFSYRSLYKATNGFDESKLLGKGGFGEVYKGTLPLENQIAVKRVSHDAERRMKQFVAEIASMRRLKHRNLVPLLGYCRRKGELILVSEYMPNGSLDEYLFTTRRPVLYWSQRLCILKGIASALDYLHRGANQVVLHRDIKASNVMLDAGLNGRLGDFGMARIHEHGETPQTTAAVGTIGYMAPELTTMGTSTRTDVFAFGVFMLEVTCGRRPMEFDVAVEKRYLVKWVCDCWKRGSLLDARDPRFRDEYAVQEVETCLKLGLLCAQTIPEGRPTMEQVVQYLNGNLILPDISPYTPGIGVFTPIMLASPEIATSSWSFKAPSNPSQANSSMFISHTIFYGGGR